MYLQCLKKGHPHRHTAEVGRALVNSDRCHCVPTMGSDWGTRMTGNGWGTHTTAVEAAEERVAEWEAWAVGEAVAFAAADACEAGDA